MHDNELHDVDDVEVPAAPNGLDPREQEARDAVLAFINGRRKDVFFSRQLEVLHEDKFYHWITNRAIRGLIEDGHLQGRMRKSSVGSLRIVWHPSNRYHKRKEEHLVKLVEEYGSPAVGVGLGLVGELLVLEGFALHRFVLLGREVHEFEGHTWAESAHDLDFILARDGIRYGIEVKNTLRYMAHAELVVKIRMCNFWGIRPVFVCRMLPRDWIREVRFSLILKWQLYPWTHADLAKRVKEQLGLSVDSPRRLAEGTMQRFLNWHNELVNP